MSGASDLCEYFVLRRLLNNTDDDYSLHDHLNLYVCTGVGSDGITYSDGFSVPDGFQPTGIPTNATYWNITNDVTQHYVTNHTDIFLPQITGDGGTVTHFALSASGIISSIDPAHDIHLIWGELTTPTVIENNDIMKFSSGTLVITIK